MKMEIKINLSNFTENERNNPALTVMSFGYTPTELYRNAVILHKETVRDMLTGGYGADIIRYDTDKKTYRVRVFKWTSESGTVYRAAAGNKSEKRIRGFIAEHDSFSMFSPKWDTLSAKRISLTCSMKSLNGLKSRTAVIVAMTV